MEQSSDTDGIAPTTTSEAKSQPQEQPLENSRKFEKFQQAIWLIEESLPEFTTASTQQKAAECIQQLKQLLLEDKSSIPPHRTSGEPTETTIQPLSQSSRNITDIFSSDIASTRESLPDDCTSSPETLMHSLTEPQRGRIRASSCHDFGRNKPSDPSSPLNSLVSWDDLTLRENHSHSRPCLGHSSRDELFSDLPRRVPENETQTEVFIRRTEGINTFDFSDESDSDSYSESEPSTPIESLGSNKEVDFLQKRLLQPVEYFEELDHLTEKVFSNSMFTFYVDRTVATPFTGRTSFKAPFPVPLSEQASTQICKKEEILDFCGAVSRLATDNGYEMGVPGAGEHYNETRMYDRPIIHLNQLIECRNIMLLTWESVKQMKAASYCGDFISMLVLDRTRSNVAKLVRIDCSEIKDLVDLFEISLLQILSYEPYHILLDYGIEVCGGISSACHSLLTELGVGYSETSQKPPDVDVWQCVAHILNTAVLSYATAHTQFFVDEAFTSVGLPGPFLETQYFLFRRRSFECLGDFLGGRQAWVLEIPTSDTPLSEPQFLYLSADPITFGDIWGPMWKECIDGDENQIIHYNIGSGVIIPWELPPKVVGNIRKGEMFCHWMPENTYHEARERNTTAAFTQDDVLLIGAKVKLERNLKCQSSPNGLRQRLQNAGSLLEPGTEPRARTVSSETVLLQVSAPYVTGGYQRQYKMRGKSHKQVIIEQWKYNPEGRRVRWLEFKLGLEVSSCTHNARRRTLIELFGSRTMVNHLRGGTIQWPSTECEESFYSSIRSKHRTAFRDLYESHPDWQPIFGKVIELCLVTLADTGNDTSNLKLNLFWAPNLNPGYKVTLGTTELPWIGFLRDTEKSGTLAVLEDRCLELVSSDLARKCQNDDLDPKHASGRFAKHDETFYRPILETSIELNEDLVPDSMIKMPCINCNGNKNPSPRHKYMWSVSSLEKGSKFQFGKKGQLKCITPLARGQIPANWRSSWDFLGPARNNIVGSWVLGVLERGAQQPQHHYECIRNESTETCPLRVLITDVDIHSPTPAQVSSVASSHTRAASIFSAHPSRVYVHNSSADSRPRTMPNFSQSIGDQSVTMNNLRTPIPRSTSTGTPEPSSDIAGLRELIPELISAEIRLPKSTGPFEPPRP